jgi:hypothetical protein
MKKETANKKRYRSKMVCASALIIPSWNFCQGVQVFIVTFCTSIKLNDSSASWPRSQDIFVAVLATQRVASADKLQVRNYLVTTTTNTNYMTSDNPAPSGLRWCRTIIIIIVIIIFGMTALYGPQLP